MGSFAAHVPAVCADIEPVEVMPAAGDVLFFDILTAHSGSANTSTQPRMAISHKYGIMQAAGTRRWCPKDCAYCRERDQGCDQPRREWVKAGSVGRKRCEAQYIL